MVSYIFQTIEFHFTCHSTGKYHSSLFCFLQATLRARATVSLSSSESSSIPRMAIMSCQKSVTLQLQPFALSPPHSPFGSSQDTIWGLKKSSQLCSMPPGSNFWMMNLYYFCFPSCELQWTNPLLQGLVVLQDFLRASCNVVVTFETGFIHLVIHCFKFMDKQILRCLVVNES